MFDYFYVALSAYLLGSVPCGFLLGKVNGIDIRDHGSGNIGATNVNRVLGRKWGSLCFLLDVLKGLLPVLVVRLLQRHGILSIESELLPVLAAFFPVAGHNWSVFLGFRGGKGIATSAGSLLGLCPVPTVISLFSWVLIFKFSRYVSLASICAAIILPVSAWLLSFFYPSEYAPFILWFLVILALIAIIRHHGNIRRLIQGTENRFERK